MIETLKHFLMPERGRTERKETRCACCGDCCRSFGGHLNASKADLERWRAQGRTDLLCRVNRLGWIWIDPESGKMEENCPFLALTEPGTATCSIHETKPAMCRDYPTLAHGHRCLRGGFLKASLAAVGGAVCECERIASVIFN